MTQMMTIEDCFIVDYLLMTVLTNACLCNCMISECIIVAMFKQ